MSQRRRRWTNIKTTFFQSIVLTGITSAQPSSIIFVRCLKKLFNSLSGYVQIYSTAQSQRAVSAYFTSKQILPFAFAEQLFCLFFAETIYHYYALSFTRYIFCNDADMITDVLTLKALINFRINHGDQRVFSIWNHHKFLSNNVALSNSIKYLYAITNIPIFTARGSTLNVRIWRLKSG